MNSLEKLIGYEFNNKTLLETCLTHSTYSHAYAVENNERMEFLGDSILNCLITEFLYLNFESREGELSKIRAIIVSAKNLSQVMDDFNIVNFLKVFPADLTISEKMKCDFYESLLGAIYLDGGMEKARDFVYKTLNLSKDGISLLMKNNRDYKSIFQEEMQKLNCSFEFRIDKYEQINAKCFFEISLFVNGKLIATEQAESKKKAENLCAKKYLEKVGNIIC